MKILRVILPVFVILALAAAIPTAQVFAANDPAGATMGKTHDIKGEVVSIDSKANTITIKEDSGENHTSPLTGRAIEQAKNFKAGDKVTATCTDNDKGEHQGISALKKA